MFKRQCGLGGSWGARPYRHEYPLLQVLKSRRRGSVHSCTSTCSHVPDFSLTGEKLMYLIVFLDCSINERSLCDEMDTPPKQRDRRRSEGGKSSSSRSRMFGLLIARDLKFGASSTILIKCCAWVLFRNVAYSNIIGSTPFL